MNKWAAALQHRPGVYIVSSVDDVLGVVATLRPDLDDILAGVLAVDGRAWGALVRHREEADLRAIDRRRWRLLA